MGDSRMIRLMLAAIFLTAIGFSCSPERKKTHVLFEVLKADKTGIRFSNQLTAQPGFNMLKYMYFYNGAGAGAGDFNNDGKTDLFFASNQSQNKLYLNEGNLKFREITKEAKIPDDGGWSTGVSIADVNDDGWLDIYVCRVGNFESLHSKNQLLICRGIDKNGMPYYEDEAKKYGIDFSGFSTQAAFLDYDLDGDLDIFLLNHSLRYNSTFAPRSDFAGTVDSLSKDILYRNDGVKFTDVSKEAGIHQSVIGYGLGIVISDLNMDGWPDIYIGNDFHENDYLYINNRKGGFTDELTERTMHSSQFSMGVDAGDINNDGWPDIIAADMLPSDPYILRRSLGEDEYNTFLIKLRNGYNYQYARNTLQLNRGNGLYSEIGLYANVAATDWSWATLWMDFDNDGWKDLFISNGIPKRMNDIDYVNYISNDEIQSKIRANGMNEKDMTLIDKFPQIKLPNRFFRNKGDASFEDVGEEIPDSPDTFSNGAVYADLDNDGDLDIVVNNIDEPVLIYRNTTSDNADKPAIQVTLKGKKGNSNAVGAKLILFSENNVTLYEKFPVHGFQSAMEVPILAGLINGKHPDSAYLVWPDNTCQKITFSVNNTHQSFNYKPGLAVFDYSILQKRGEKKEAPIFENITANTNLFHKHIENYFIEFDREPLMPFMVSREGPALSVADINNDGLDDFFIGSVKWEKSVVYLQQTSGTFRRMLQPALEKDSTYEDIDACWSDMNNDGFADLIVASGGNEYYGNSEFLAPRLYLNDGKGNLSRKPDAFNNVLVTASVILANDFNSDGKTDLFIGGRAEPFEYGKKPRSFILQNDGSGRFTDVTSSFNQDINNIGFVKNAVLSDADNDGDNDLILALEWDGIYGFMNDKSGWKKKYITGKRGWWNFVLPVDIDNDGDTDFITGNQGLNSRLKASEKEPVRFYYYDFDDNGKKEQIITYYLQGEEIPFANKAELERQMPGLKKKYLYAEDFAKASIREIFGAEKLKKADLFTADYFANAVLINKGNWKFVVKELPWQAQLTSYRDATIVDINNDELPDILLAGNFYPNNIQLGRYDADYGSLLINKGKGVFSCEQIKGTLIKGEARHIRDIKIAGKNAAIIIAKNDDSLQIIQKEAVRK